MIAELVYRVRLWLFARALARRPPSRRKVPRPDPRWTERRGGF